MAISRSVMYAAELRPSLKCPAFVVLYQNTVRLNFFSLDVIAAQPIR
jgi:hypothetical protein